MDTKARVYLTTQQAARRIQLSPRTLERKRLDGTGPRFRKAGNKVLYLLSDLDDWLDEHCFSSTSEAQYAAEQKAAAEAYEEEQLKPTSEDVDEEEAEEDEAA